MTSACQRRYAITGGGSEYVRTLLTGVRPWTVRGRGIPPRRPVLSIELCSRDGRSNGSPQLREAAERVFAATTRTGQRIDQRRSTLYYERGLVVMRSGPAGCTWRTVGGTTLRLSSPIPLSPTFGKAPSMSDVLNLPGDLPVPVDDGACDHLPGTAMPRILLPATGNNVVDIGSLADRSVIYAYPRTRPEDEPGRDDWDLIPGARGCTPEACSFRDHHAEFRELGAGVFGLSTQTTRFQQEVVDRLRLPFALLSDERLELVSALRLPTMAFDGMTLIRRLTLVIRDTVVEHVFYPVFPPDRHAVEVRDWLAAHP